VSGTIKAGRHAVKQTEDDLISAEVFNQSSLARGDTVDGVS